VNILLRPHVIPYPLSTGPPPIVLPHNYPTTHPRMYYTSFPLAPGAAAWRTAIEAALEVVRLGWGGILVICDMRYFDLGRKNGEDWCRKNSRVFFPGKGGEGTECDD
jgi:hypothetical protein